MGGNLYDIKRHRHAADRLGTDVSATPAAAAVGRLQGLRRPVLPMEAEKGTRQLGFGTLPDGVRAACWSSSFSLSHAPPGGTCCRAGGRSASGGKHGL